MKPSVSTLVLFLFLTGAAALTGLAADGASEVAVCEQLEAHAAHDIQQALDRRDVPRAAALQAESTARLAQEARIFQAGVRWHLGITLGSIALFAIALLARLRHETTRLAIALSALCAGQYGTRLESSGRDEFATLGRYFNGTALRLGLRLAERKEALAFPWRLLEDSPTGLMLLAPVLGPDGTTVDFDCRYANHAADRLFVRPRGDLSGGRLQTLLPGFGADGLFARLSAVAHDGRRLRLEHHFEHDRVSKCLVLEATRCPDGVLLAIMDVSSHRRPSSGERLTAG